MFDIAKPSIKEIEKTDDNRYGKYVIEPLERGYGTTLGSVLRRTLLSSIPGTAITQMKIDGILHEFMPLKGLKEDISELIANLKKVNIKNTNKGPEQKYAYINVSGIREIKAGDIQIGGSLEIVNPDLVIGHLGMEDAVFNAEFIITDGYGYKPAARDSELVEYLPLDAIYSPILRVVPSIENARIDQDTDYDKLILEIYTDGTISPKDAISMAGTIITDQMKLFVDFAESDNADPFIENTLIQEESDVLGETGIEELDLSLRTYNALKNAGIETIADLIPLSDKELQKLNNIGEKAINEINLKMQAYK